LIGFSASSIAASIVGIAVMERSTILLHNHGALNIVMDQFTQALTFFISTLNQTFNLFIDFLFSNSITPDQFGNH